MWILVSVLFVCWFPSLDAASVVEKIVQWSIGTFVRAGPLKHGAYKLYSLDAAHLLSSLAYFLWLTNLMLDISQSFIILHMQQSVASWHFVSVCCRLVYMKTPNGKLECGK
jgi:hypothetical protein